MKKNVTILLALLVCFMAWAQQPVKKTVTVNGVSFKMVQVEGGCFNMGGTCEQLKSSMRPEDDEYPIHVVTLDDYYIGETEVTQELWQAVMGDNPSGFTGDSQLPVERIWWLETQTFVEKLNELTGCTFRLPTEAEWEYAARGGRYTHYYMYSGSDDIDEVAWHDGDCTHPVAQKQPNELGIYDMSGNVFEWCQDWFDDYDMFPQENPQGPSDGENRVRRGGSWGGSLKGPRVSYRNYELPNIRWNYIGMRLAATEVEETVTGTAAPAAQTPKTGQRYNVMGQRLDNSATGLIIEDGEKRLVR